MPHIDEGNLHALLDGALTGDDAAATRAHLQLCSNCRARLEEAERIREHADAILAGAAPVAAAPPDFEEILARARAVGPSPQGPPRAGTPARLGAPRTLAWAASLALALAGGWWAHELTRGPLTPTGSAAAPKDRQATRATPVAPSTLARAAGPLGAASTTPPERVAEAARGPAGGSGGAAPASIGGIAAERRTTPSGVSPGAAPAAPTPLNVSAAVPAGAPATDITVTGFAARARKDMAPAPAAGELAAGATQRGDAAAPLTAKAAVAQEGMTGQRAPQPSAAPPATPSSVGGSEPRDLLGPITVVEPTLLP